MHTTTIEHKYKIGDYHWKMVNRFLKRFPIEGVSSTKRNGQIVPVYHFTMEQDQSFDKDVVMFEEDIVPSIFAWKKIQLKKYQNEIDSIIGAAEDEYKEKISKTVKK